MNLHPFATAAAFLMLLNSTRAESFRTQTFQLHPGWNSISLEVQPTISKPAELFAKLPVDKVACFFPGQGEAQYLKNPGDAPWREEGWAVWNSDTQPESFLSNLHDIRAPRPLLVHATSQMTWTVTGEARPSQLKWYPNTCTFTGLPVEAANPPTFAQFFSASQAHQKRRVFKLTDGAWRMVSNPNTERIQSGEAYWIQTDGASTYQGPLRVKLPAVGELNFDVSGSGKTLEILNESSNIPALVRVEVIGSTASLPLHQVTRDVAKAVTTRVSLPAKLELPPLAASQGTSLRIEPIRDAMPKSIGSTLLRITDGRGSEIWVPIRARRSGTSTAFLQP